MNRLSKITVEDQGYEVEYGMNRYAVTVELTMPGETAADPFVAVSEALKDFL